MSDDPLTLDELVDEWPKDESGRMAARLIKRYFVTRLIDQSTGAECIHERAQAEASANKILALILKDINALGKSAPEKKPITPTLKPLLRNQPR
jgi:hypothetical protein